MPRITIPLGISPKSRPSIGKLRKRARERVELAAANQPELSFLNQTDFAENMPLVPEGDCYALQGPIPEVQNASLFNRDGRANVLRGDDAQEARIREVLAALAVSSQTLEDVAQLMATSDNVKQDITEFGRSIGIDTKWVRKFVYEKQKQFDVMVDGEGVTFRAQAVRVLAPRGEPIYVQFTQPPPRPEGKLVRGRVDATLGDNREVGVQKGGAHDFRLGLLEPWQAALIDCARHFQFSILVTAGEAETTCGLTDAPVSITKVHNWPELLMGALTEFSNAAKTEGEQA